MRKHQERRVVGVAGKLPHGPPEQVVEAANDVAAEDSRTVVRLKHDEVVGRVGAWQVDYVKLPVQVARSAVSVGPRAVMPSASRSI